MDNETTMPGLLTRPAALYGAAGGERGRPLYKLIFVLAVLALGVILALI
ncbi:MAG: hypothetical protein KGL73_04160 [Burkholderiales bacterium]|nr:hypothetical protein [Burkholderiales bacterium]